ncbi:hypothetical protein SeMB42_g05626, partial [Synchytrium endobioticum]
MALVAWPAGKRHRPAPLSSVYTNLAREVINNMVLKTTPSMKGVDSVTMVGHPDVEQLLSIAYR